MMNNISSAFNFSSDTSPYDGYIDNVMIFDRELANRDINFLWNRGNGTEECEGENWNTSTSSSSSS